MNRRKSITITIIIIPMLLLASLVTLSDDRINQAHHFGGDSLYCDSSIGCWMLDSNGTQLWDIPQSLINSTIATACETGNSEVLEVGAGTYGLFWLDVSCYEGIDPYFTLVGFDEHGKINRMRFSPDYMPVYSAPASTSEPEAPEPETTPEIVMPL